MGGKQSSSFMLSMSTIKDWQQRKEKDQKLFLNSDSSTSTKQQTFFLSTVYLKVCNLTLYRRTTTLNANKRNFLMHSFYFTKNLFTAILRPLPVPVNHVRRRNLRV